MLDSYKRRLSLTGNNITDALIQQNNQIMNAKFKDTINYKKVLINDVFVDARYISYKTTSITGDNIDYLLQFRPGINFPLGTLVKISNNNDIYETWMLVGFSDDITFPKYNIVKCNYILNWIVDKQVVSSPCALRSKGTSIGTKNNEYMAIIDGQLYAWLPTNDYVNSLDYKSRFLITSNKKYPKAYKVTDFNDILTVGVTKLTLIRDEISANDNAELLVADYYKIFPKVQFPIGNLRYEIIGLDYITVNSSNTYKIQALDENNNLIPIDSYECTLKDITGNDTDIAYCTSIINDEIVITSNDVKGVFKIKILVNDSSISKTIKIKGLL